MRIYRWLYPLSWLYGLGVRLRNAMFDAGILPSQTFALAGRLRRQSDCGRHGKDASHGVSHPPAHAGRFACRCLEPGL